MKLVRFGEKGAERPGIWVAEPAGAKILDVRASVFDIEDYNEHFFAHFGLKRLENLLREKNAKYIEAGAVRLGPPIARPGKIICLGKNYAAHAQEFGSQVPASPILFSKATSAIIGPHDNIVLPPDAGQVDGEVELAVVIGQAARRVSADKAFDCVAGYMILNDVTDRRAQKEGQQWFRGKGADTFCPLGPWLVTKGEIGNPDNLRMKLVHNGKVLQDETTAKMVFKIPYLIAFISASITLLPGDVIATGTPSGIGSAHKPPVLFRPGDKIELTVDGLGIQANKILAV